MGWDATGTLPPPHTDPTRPAPASGRRGLVLAATTVAGGLVIAGGVWWTARLGGDTVPMIVSVALTAAVAVVVGLVGRRSSRAARRAAVTATLAVGAACLVLATSGVVVAAKVRAQLPAWTAEAERLLAEPAADAAPLAGSGCESFPVDPPELAGFGRVDQRCVQRSPTHRMVSFSQKDPMGGWTGLVFSPGHEPGVMSMCLAHLAGPWWQTASALPNCPGGFTFVGGG